MKTPLRIAIDASRATVDAPTGTEHYARRLIGALLRANDALPAPHRITLYFRDKPAPGLFPASERVSMRVIPWLRAWTHWRFALELWRTRPDLTFVPAHTLPFLFPGSGLVTAHDLGFRRFPAAHPRPQRAYLDLTTRFSQARARIVIADSQATAADLGRFYGTPPGKIRVLYPGVDAEPLTTDAESIARVRRKYQLPARYFLFLGTLQPRKNIQRLAQAFALWQQQQGDHETALALAGGRGWLYDPSWTRAARNLKLLGYIDEADKGALLAGALALVFPSLYEGFGFPVIEAMICGAPVIASDSSSLPELVGEAGLLVDPLDIAAIAAAMQQYSADEDLRARMIARGRARAREFTWTRAAERLLAILDEFAREQT